MQPDQITPVSFRLQDVLHTFRPGHRIMVQLQSSWFPAFDRNPQHYVPNIYQADSSDFVMATERIGVDRAEPRLSGGSGRSVRAVGGAAGGWWLVGWWAGGWWLVVD